MDKRIREVMEKLHNDVDIPRLEIEGYGESIESQYLGFFPSQGRENKRVVYVLNDWYDESGGGSDNDWDWTTFSRRELENLIEQALYSRSGKAKAKIAGIRTRFRERWNCDGEGWEEPRKDYAVLMNAYLKVGKKKGPEISIKYEVD